MADHAPRDRLATLAAIALVALHRQDAEADTDIAYMLSEHACEPLDSEIERIESILASCPRRHRQQEARA
jgi:hypothetical protein